MARPYPGEGTLAAACPSCHGPCKICSEISYTTIPPRYDWVCPVCKERFVAPYLEERIGGGAIKEQT